MKFNGSSYQEADSVLGMSTSMTFDGLTLSRTTTGAIVVTSPDVTVGLLSEGDITIELSESGKLTAARYRVNQFLPEGFKFKVSGGKPYLNDLPMNRQAVVMPAAESKVATDVDATAVIPAAPIEPEPVAVTLAE
jgi:hypothetical protein